MGDSFDTVPLSEIVDPDRGISYGIVQPGQHRPNGVPIIRVTDIRNGRVDSGAPLCVAPDIAAKYKRTHLRGGELLLTLVGTVGETAVVPPALEGWNTARAVAVVPVLPDPGPRWVRYALATGPAREYIETRLNTTVQATLNLRDVSTFPVPMPSRSVRDAVLDILGTLDDKIELNRRMNETLEAMARALFKSWFVDFDPVRAKAQGQTPPGMDPATAALFPSEFQDSALGEIPNGSRVRRVGDSFVVVMGQSPPGSTYNEAGDGLPFYQGRRDFGFRYPSQRVWCSAPTREAHPGDTLVSVRAPVGDLNIAAEHCCIGRGVAAVRHKSRCASFTYYSMQSLEPQFARFEAEGTVFGSINKRGFEDLLLVETTRDVLEAFSAIAGRLDDRIATNSLETTSLGRLRDELLPRLLSGELSVAHAEQAVEATA